MTIQFHYFLKLTNNFSLSWVCINIISVHNINNDKAPAKTLNLFQKTSQVHSYNTWPTTSRKFYVKSARLEIQNNSFSRPGVNVWNEIPPYITDLPKKTFKRVLRTLLFVILEKEDDYIQIPAIIKEVGLCRWIYSLNY